MGRIGTGLTAATIPLVVALAFAAAGEATVSAAFVVVTVVIIVLTCAPWIWALHRLPIFGAPRLELTFRANGANELNPEAARGELVLCIPRDEPMEPVSVIVELEVKNPTSIDVGGAMLNFGCPTGLGMKFCDGWGNPVAKGSPRLPTVDGFDYQSVSDPRYSAGTSSLVYLRFIARRPGVFPVYAELGSGDLYRNHEVTRFVDIRVVVTDDVPYRDKLTPLIVQGESARRDGPSVVNEARLRDLAFGLYMGSTRVLLEAERQDFLDRLANAEPDHVGLRSGDAYHRAAIAAYTRTLIEIRDIVGREEAA